ncbi:CBO0543 family protein [Robertmurraya korlensis]|uniref:CBO0543 family protein n=1 Tax=Robertmurraya korlensis TaxID=519977 RepID=UPI000824186C|nr:CBO0543 family protein [Robertmurraya korlensis]
MSFQDGLSKVDKGSDLIKEGNHLIIDATMNAFLFTWQWWVAVLMIIVPWVLWAIFRKKESSARLLFSAFIVMILSTNIDSIGVEHGLWTYPVKAIPIPTISYSFRYSLMPVLIMFFLQYKPNANPLVKGIILAGISAYIGMPLMAMVDMYKKIDWAYTNSFFIILLLYLVAHWFSKRKSFQSL